MSQQEEVPTQSPDVKPDPQGGETINVKVRVSLINEAIGDVTLNPPVPQF